MGIVFIGIDDTDTLESPGTGHLARVVAGALSGDYSVLGVTRHQLLRDPRVPYTKKNSSAAILVSSRDGLDPPVLLDRVRTFMADQYQPGSDPGLCVASTVPLEISEFGRRAQREVLTQSEARALAVVHQISLLGLGGDESGVIGALAAVGLAATGDDGRYVLVGRSRELSGLRAVSEVLEAGVDTVQTTDGRHVSNGLVRSDRLRPARRGGRPVVIVRWDGEYWQPLKLD